MNATHVEAGPDTPRHVQTAHANSDKPQGSTTPIDHLRGRVTVLEKELHTPDDTSCGTHNCILDSGANATNTASPCASVRRSIETLNTSATRHRAPVSHTGIIIITQKNKSVNIPAVHTRQIQINLISVHDLMEHGNVTFTRNKAMVR